MNDKPKKHYTPTKLCPHRHCRTAHTILFVTLMLFLCTSFTLGILGLLFMGLLSALSLPLIKMVHGGKSFKEIAIEDEKTRGDLIVRPVWAFIALCTDIVFIAVGLADAYSDLADPTTMSIPAPTADHLIKIAIAIGLSVFGPYAHIMATKPVRKVRVPVPAGVGA